MLIGKGLEHSETLKSPHFFVRHGRYDSFDKSLTDEGQEDALKAATHLSSRGLGREALILCSSSKRAIQSAEIIGRELYSQPIISNRIAECGEVPELINDLDLLLNEALADNGEELAPFQALVVVTHAPLIEMISKKMPDYGEVVEYIPGSWQQLTS